MKLFFNPLRSCPDPEAIEQVIQLSERDEARSERDRLEKERAEVEKRIERLVSAIERGAEVSSVVMKLRELEERRKTIDEEIAGLRPVPRLAPEVVESRLAEWRRLIRGNTTQARAVLQRILRGRITFVPREDGGYDFSAPTRFDKLFSGVASQRPGWMGARNP